MKENKICIVIPTRERAQTLKATLETCVSQKYSNLQILVSDNDSKDNTQSVVKKFNDHRITYINTNSRLSMSNNWEFALSKIDADYVTFVGDDDGVLPNAVQDLNLLINTYKFPVIAWKKIEYCWPSHSKDFYKNFLSIPLCNGLVECDSKAMLFYMYKFLVAYSKGPCIYNSIVSINCINDVIGRDGVMFGAACPDVYSALCLASVTKKYLFSSRPFSINGASAFSNGTSSMIAGVDFAPYKQFLSEMNSSGASFYKISGSITAAVVDSLVNFKSSSFLSPKINFKRVFFRICKELKYTDSFTESNIMQMQLLADQYYKRDKLNNIINKYRHKMQKSKLTSLYQNCGINLNIQADNFDVNTVDQACILSAKILRQYDAPDKLRKFSLIKYMFSKFVSKFYGILNEYAL